MENPFLEGRQFIVHSSSFRLISLSLNGLWCNDVIPQRLGLLLPCDFLVIPYSVINKVLFNLVKLSATKDRHQNTDIQMYHELVIYSTYCLGRRHIHFEGCLSFLSRRLAIISPLPWPLSSTPSGISSLLIGISTTLAVERLSYSLTFSTDYLYFWIPSFSSYTFTYLLEIRCVLDLCNVQSVTDRAFQALHANFCVILLVLAVNDMALIYHRLADFWLTGMIDRENGFTYFIKIHCRHNKIYK